MANNFIDAVKEMHLKMERAQTRPAPSAPSAPPANTIADTITLLKRYPRLLFPRTGR
jgi:hypothetical protein